MTVIILCGITIKCMELVRFERNLGNLVKLVGAVVYDVRYFFVFIILNICMFALFYISLGYKIVDEVDIEDFSYYTYIIESWKIATKGSSPNLHSFWDSTEDFRFVENILMIVTILNEIYLKIIMMSFLIAVVKTTFSD